MTLLIALYIANIIVIMVLVSCLLYSILEIRYGLYWSIARVVFHWDFKGIRGNFKEMMNNPIKIIDLLLAIVLFFIGMSLTGKLIDNEILDRPILNLGLSPIAWALVLLYICMTKKKINTLQECLNN